MGVVPLHAVADGVMRATPSKRPASVLGDRERPIGPAEARDRVQSVGFHLRPCMGYQISLAPGGVHAGPLKLVASEKPDEIDN